MNREEPSSPIRVLLIEDSEHDQIAFKRALRQSIFPFEVTVCERAEEIPPDFRIGEDSFDLVVVDYNLPGQNGLEIFCKLRQRPDLPPFVMLTGTDSHYLAADALKAGMQACIVKDPEREYLQRLSLKLLDIRQRSRQYRNKANGNDSTKAQPPATKQPV